MSRVSCFLTYGVVYGSKRVSKIKTPLVKAEHVTYTAVFWKWCEIRCKLVFFTTRKWFCYRNRWPWMTFIVMSVVWCVWPKKARAISETDSWASCFSSCIKKRENADKITWYGNSCVCFGDTYDGYRQCLLARWLNKLTVWSKAWLETESLCPTRIVKC